MRVHPCMKKNLHKRNHLSEDQPDINHLDIGRWWKALRYTDEECCQDKKGGEVDGDYGLKKEIFEEVCSIDNNEDEYSWKIYCKGSIVDPSLEYSFNVQTLRFIF